MNSMIGRRLRDSVMANVMIAITLVAAVTFGRGASAQSVAPPDPPPLQAPAADGPARRVVPPDPLSWSSPTNLNGRTSAMVPLNAGDFQAFTLAGGSDVYFVSGNGRYVLRGTIHDLWQGRELVTLQDIRTATETVNFAALAKMIPDFAPFMLGHGKRQEVLFVDPFCPYCRMLLESIVARGDDPDYQYVILPVALLGPNSVRVVRNLQCASDRNAALQALLTHTYDPPLPQVASCEIAPVEKRAIFARLLQIKGVPFLIRHDGARQDGLPPDLGGWLREARG